MHRDEELMCIVAEVVPYASQSTVESVVTTITDLREEVGMLRLQLSTQNHLIEELDSRLTLFEHAVDGFVCIILIIIITIVIVHIFVEH